MTDNILRTSTLYVKLKNEYKNKINIQIDILIEKIMHLYTLETMVSAFFYSFLTYYFTDIRSYLEIIIEDYNWNECLYIIKIFLVHRLFFFQQIDF